MFRVNLFYKFFKHKRNSNNKIVKSNSNPKLDLQNQLQLQIIETDKKISENSKALLDAQIVKFRSTLSKSNNLIEKIGKNIYKEQVEDSIIWHQKKLRELYFRRKKLQINLDKIQGVFWINRIKRFLTILFIGFFILFCLFIFVSGFIIIIYLLPLILLIILAYLIFTKRY
tara:strand:- start:45 stop:557 length:513 start_codon:yes stop_codon:yes gene_type:complete